MGKSLLTGPVVAAGPMLGGPNAPDTNFAAGPSLFYQGTGFLDPRVNIMQSGIGSLKSFLLKEDVRVIDQFPMGSTAVPSGIASVQNVAIGVPMVLSGSNNAIPFYPVGQVSNPITPALTLDFGICIASVVAGSNVVTFPAGFTSYFQAGQFIVLADVGNGAGTAPLFARVTSVASATSMTISAVPSVTSANTHIGTTDISSPLSAAGTATAQAPYLAGGVGGFMDPSQVVGRGVAVGGSAAATGGAFLVSGWDVWGQVMSELVTVAAGAVSGYGKKAFKHIGSVVPQFTDAHNYSVGVSDVVGFPMRCDGWQYNEIYLASLQLVTSVGFTPAFTGVSTSTTGDVRGTIQTGPRGPLGTGASGTSLDGGTKVTAVLSFTVAAVLAATQAGSASLFGVAQA